MVAIRMAAALGVRRSSFEAWSPSCCRSRARLFGVGDPWMITREQALRSKFFSACRVSLGLLAVAAMKETSCPPLQLGRLLQIADGVICEHVTRPFFGQARA